MGKVSIRVYYYVLILLGILLPLLSFGAGRVGAQAPTTTVNRRDDGTCIVQCLVHLDKYKIATQNYYHRVNTSKRPGSARIIKTNQDIHYLKPLNASNRWTTNHRRITHKTISVYIN